MNLLFALLSTAGTLLVLGVIAPLLPKKGRIKRLSLLGAFMMCIVFYFSLMTYGPRVQLQKTAMPRAPEPKKIEAGKQIFQSDDKWVRMKEAIKENEARQEIE